MDTLPAPMLAAMIMGIVFVLLVAALFASFMVPRRSGAPYFPTPEPALRAAFKEVGLKPGEIFYDLGAGTGPAIRIAADEFGARATGFEIAPVIFLIAKIKLALSRSRARLIYKSLWSADIRDADVVFFFLAERVTARVEEKLKRELRPGTRVIAYTFGPPNMNPSKIIPVRDGWRVLLYEIK